MLKSVSRAVQLAARLSSVPSAPAIRPALHLSRTFTRSIWSLSNSGAASGSRPRLLTATRALPTVSCGCGSLHTEGDKAFGEFLNDEIKEEKKIQKNKSLPKMSGGWELELNGTEAKLIRSLSGEKVTITFNVNNSIPPQLEEEPEHTQKSQEEEPDIVSTPNFVVEVTKPGAKNSLVFDCHFPEDETGHGDGEEESDIFAIREVSFQPEGDADWKETSYTLNTDSLDWALYDHLMDFLADRGVDNTFADELIDLSTALEHQEYIKFLEDLSTFVKCK
ncbi:complement component 1 Q subcomponent-binding mitochondrial [Labeo rohita]|uniref:Complement component 1 Q subcomponent-binding protein, mitochondrial n=2 Tax=Labeo rohita TaxID=84645 RepID=A0A498NKL6_LABRO|nr:complement component 1 Q subcomponent-binding protein, mitochondrial isoform X2 [Labeo rohita]KAI2665066.1 Complement component 1 Q subcomponent-binding protein, mitochondrial [Labeo rohita]RXN12750.1 complement component 1 Q subcomponent-binding mitochondrial [Labeo rohita]RXN32433.1 complement component 1 Q subcomponent-binding mitochondrial [Labeo rohita]